MRNTRDSLLALALSSLLAFSESKRKVLCYGQRHRFTQRSRHYERFETESGGSLIEQTLLHVDHVRDCSHHTSKIPSLTTNCAANAPIISFGLTKNGVSGGFGDRLRGMVTTYYLAMMTNSSFEVHWTRPYDLSNFFTVPSCDGDAARAKHQKQNQSSEGNSDDAVSLPSFSELSDGRDSKKIVRTVIDDWTYFTDSLFLGDDGKDIEISTNSFHWQDVVRNQAFRERALSLGLLGLSQAELFKLAVDELFGNPTSVVRESFKSVMRRLAGGQTNAVPYVGVQIRLGGKNSNPVSGWDDPSRHSPEQVKCFAVEAMRICHRIRIGSIFVTADSEEAVREFANVVARESASASSSYPSPPPIVVHVPGIIGHTDRSSVAKEHAQHVWLKSIVDWWVLKHASALVISRSGYGETAAMSSDAETALRLKLSSWTGAATNAGDNGTCDFEELSLHDTDVIQHPM